MSDAIEAAQVVVLLVEDEPLVRMCAADILEDEGFEVIEATTAPAALKILEKRDDMTALFTGINVDSRQFEPGGFKRHSKYLRVLTRLEDAHLSLTPCKIF